VFVLGLSCGNFVKNTSSFYQTKKGCQKKLTAFYYWCNLII
jgi:hypothetical protein